MTVRGLQVISTTPQRLRQIVASLFPVHHINNFEKEDAHDIHIFTIRELIGAGKELATGKPPGPDLIPTEIIKAVIIDCPQPVLDVINVPKA